MLPQSIKNFFRVVPCFLVISCGTESSSNSKSIFGAHDFTVIEETQGRNFPLSTVGALFLLSQDETGRTRIFQKYCSGVQISRKHVLTNAHCMKYKAPETYVDMHFSKEYVALDGQKSAFRVDDLYGGIYLRFTGGTRLDDVPVAERKPNVRVVFVAHDLDYAVLEIMGDSYQNDAHVRLDSFSEISDQAHLAAIGFPNAMPLTRSQNCRVLAVNNAELRHNCDTLTGSSGGLIYDEDSGLPLALHRQGAGQNSTEYYRQYGQSEGVEELAARQCRETFKLDPQDPSFLKCIELREKEDIFNRAIPLSRIAESLMRENPDLYRAVI